MQASAEYASQVVVFQATLKVVKQRCPAEDTLLRLVLVTQFPCMLHPSSQRVHTAVATVMSHREL